jgi:hypothetical protein
LQISKTKSGLILIGNRIGLEDSGSPLVEMRFSIVQSSSLKNFNNKANVAAGGDGRPAEMNLDTCIPHLDSKD